MNQDDETSSLLPTISNIVPKNQHIHGLFLLYTTLMTDFLTCVVLYILDIVLYENQKTPRNVLFDLIDTVIPCIFRIFIGLFLKHHHQRHDSHVVFIFIIVSISVRTCLSRFVLYTFYIILYIQQNKMISISLEPFVPFVFYYLNLVFIYMISSWFLNMYIKDM